MTFLTSNRKFAHKRIALCALALPALLAVGQAGAKTLVYCSEGSPENFSPSINTTGTSFDVIEQIYDNVVQFERGGTKVGPGLAEKWTVSKDGKELLKQPEDWGGLSDSGQRLTLARLLPTTLMPLGDYELKVLIKDRVGGQVIENKGKFTITN